MLHSAAFLLCTFPALSTVLPPSADQHLAAPPGPPATEAAAECGLPALFSWGDVDGDGRLDLAAVGSDGTLQILADTSDGRFEDVTERVGLFDVGNAALALWADYDGDGRLDLFVGAREGTSRLFHNDYGVFIDVSARTGVSSKGAVQSAEWLDEDGDGRLDLFVDTTEKSVLFRGLQSGFFEAVELPSSLSMPLRSGASEASADSLVIPPGEGRAGEDPDLGTRRERPHGRKDLGGSQTTGGTSNLVPRHSVRIGPHFPAPALIASCEPSITDQAVPANCLLASTTPTLGLLYPISSNLFVAVGGNVGIGTTSPAVKLDVAGTARMTGTLTLNPGVDPALDVSTGSIYKGGALFIHTKGGTNNTAVGKLALASVTTGNFNTASGDGALRSNTTGSSNTANGLSTLFYNTSGSKNTASGVLALTSNTTGDSNTASGYNALRANTTGAFNTASGYLALRFNTTGLFNTACGNEALEFNTSGMSNTATGNEALWRNTTGDHNTASGYQSLLFNTLGSRNTAHGARALRSNTTGDDNTASGYMALHHNTTGSQNTVVGSGALYYNTVGLSNTATGYRALRLTTGSRNTALGRNAGSALTTGNDNIAIGHNGVAGEGATIRIGTPGTHTRAFIAGIRGVTTGVANAIPVLVDSAGQLGTVSSSRRFKKDIADMGDLTDRLLELRPVVFHYKQEQKLPNGAAVPLEYGLIAEEVAEIFPDLVVYDEGGKPFTVKYHLLSSMLLNELKKQARTQEEHARAMEEQAHELVVQRTTHAREMEELRDRLAALESQATSTTRPAVVSAGGR